jgi:ribose-phosphate pyrophosphokinase
MIVLAGSTSTQLGRLLATKLNAGFGIIKKRVFPDGEKKLQIMTDLTGDTVVIVQNTYPDDAVIELLLLQDTVRDFNIKKLVTVIPYFGYARQDKKFDVGECISARALAKHIQLQSDEVITVDLHKSTIIDFFDRVPGHEASATRPITNYLATLQPELRPDLILAPDKGALERAERVATGIGCGFDYLEMERDASGRKRLVATREFDVEDKNVAIVDDIISTGGTIEIAASELKQRKAKHVYAVCTHGLFIGGALTKLSATCDLVMSTDTVENETSVISVAGEIADILGAER